MCVCVCVCRCTWHLGCVCFEVIRMDAESRIDPSIHHLSAPLDKLQRVLRKRDGRLSLLSSSPQRKRYPAIACFAGPQ